MKYFCRIFLNILARDRELCVLPGHISARAIGWVGLNTSSMCALARSLIILMVGANFVEVSRPHTSPRRFSRRGICHETREIVVPREMHNENAREESRGDLQPFLRPTLSPMRVLDTHNSTCCATAVVLTTCSLIVAAIRRTNVSQLAFDYAI